MSFTIYRDKLEQFSGKYQWISLGMVLVSVVLYYLVGGNTGTMLLVSAVFLIYALGRNREGVLENRFTRFFSSVSMEVYLSHMVVFRVIEKIGINKVFGNGWGQYVVTVVVVLGETVVFAVVLQRAFGVIGKRISLRCGSAG